MAMTLKQNIDNYAVVGNPIAHSQSPTIHAAFAKQLDQALVYQAHRVDEGQFANEARAFFDQGGKGLNITLPFKIDAYQFADRLSHRAKRAGAVNTLALQETGDIYGDNTDGVGLIHDIENNLAWTIHGKRVLILGAGGAVRGILEPLFNSKPSQLTIANRTLPKAQQLAVDFADLGDLQACSFDALHSQSFDLIINGTSASLAGDLPPLPPTIISSKGCCYDMMYSASPTAFMNWATENGAAAVADGLGMLVEQAAVSFTIWRGVKPTTKPVITLIREKLRTCLAKK